MLVQSLVQELHAKYPEANVSLDQLTEMGRLVSPRPALHSEATTLKVCMHTIFITAYLTYVLFCFVLFLSGKCIHAHVKC